MDQFTVENLTKISLSMFRKNFFGIFHGSISAKVEYNKFIINKREAIFDEMGRESFIQLYHKKDYRWKEASIDSPIHANIYQKIPDAKYIAYGLPHYTMAYSLRYDSISPKDYFGQATFGKIDVYDPKQLEDWYERADVEIYRYMRENRSNVMIIRGYGVYVYERDLNLLAKHIAIIENSCRILYLARALGEVDQDKDMYFI